MERKEFVAWLEAHKVQLVIGGVSVVASTMFVLGIKNKKTLKDFLFALEKKCAKEKIPQMPYSDIEEIYESVPAVERATRQYTSCGKCFEVNSHIRLLPEGRHHSVEKAAEALAAGIELLPNQTIVDGYVKGAA